MTLYAFDAIDDAIAATKAFLWPVDWRRWAKLAIVALFVGGAGGFNPFQFGGGGSPGSGGFNGAGPGGVDGLSSIGGTELAIIGLIVLVIAAIGLVFMLVGSIMEFVFIEALRNEVVTIRRYWGGRWQQGLRLFGFRVVLGVVSLTIIGVLLVIALAPLIFDQGTFSIGLLILAILVFVVIAIVGGVLNGFTTVFVVPIMIAENRALLSAWRRFWPTMTGQWKQYAAYAVMGFILQLAAGIAAGLATLVLAIVVAIPLAIVGAVGAAILAVGIPVVGWVIIGFAVLVFVLALIALSLLVSVPVTVFLRYYALFVLGDTNEAFDLIAERRAAVRE